MGGGAGMAGASKAGGVANVASGVCTRSGFEAEVEGGHAGGKLSRCWNLMQLFAQSTNRLCWHNQCNLITVETSGLAE